MVVVREKLSAAKAGPPQRPILKAEECRGGEERNVTGCLDILTVSHFYEQHGGGIERVAARLSQEFVRSGHRAFWAASDSDPAPSTITGAVPLRCANPIEKMTGLPMPLPGLRAMRSLYRAVRTNDVIVIHDALYVTSILAMIFAKFWRKPVILIQHIADIPFTGAVMRMLIKLANIIVTRPMLAAACRSVFISDEVRRRLEGAGAGRSALLFNGVDTSIFHPVSLDRVAILESFGLPAEARIALFVGRFVDKKGLGVIEALARQRPDVHVALAGSGPIDPDRWNLPNIHVLGQLTQRQLATLYNAADLLLLPSVGEGFPLVVQEAMACGLSIVCDGATARADPVAQPWFRAVAIDLSQTELSASLCSEAIDSLLFDPIDRVAMAAYAARTYRWSAMAASILHDLPKHERRQAASRSLDAPR